MSSTYRDLVTAITPAVNLSNVVNIPPSQPCAACTKIVPNYSRLELENIKTDYELFDTFPDFPVLKVSARAGCELCRLFRKTIRSSWGVTMRPMEEDGVGVLSAKDGFWDKLFEKAWDRKVRIFNVRFSILIHQRENNTEGSIRRLLIQFGPVNLPPPEEYDRTRNRPIFQELVFKAFDSEGTSNRRPPDNDALSERNIALMRNWINTCKDHHTTCQLNTSNNWLPTRLIQISDSDMVNVRLVETHNHFDRNLGRSVQFIALSHMWGDVSTLAPLRTLRHNYDTMKRGILIKELPQNFSDTVLVCRKLGVEYVWIDSLCIIQDNPEDWKREAVTMHLVYKYAQVTIVAAAATSSRDGFLARNIQMTPAVKASYTSKTGQQANPSIILYPINEESDPHFGYEETAWNTRGWTFQERYLSTRLIYFCKNSLHFDCRTHKASEEGEMILPSGLKSSLWPRAKLSPDKWFEAWSEAVSQYGRRKLTKGDDKLIAIQSIANEMKENALGPYINFAGVWQADIHKGLLWRPWLSTPIYPGKHRAPSWSWASLDSAVRFTMAVNSDRRFGEPLEVIRFNEGALPGMVVKAHTRHISSIVRHDFADWYDEAQNGNDPYDIFTDEPASSDDTTTRPWGFAYGTLDRFDDNSIREKQACFMYLHVSDSHESTGLILKKRTIGTSSNELSTDVWSRIGTARVFKDWREQRLASKGFEGQEMREVIIV